MPGVTTGIGQSLISTAAGLIVAISSLVFYRLFQGFVVNQVKVFRRSGSDLELLYRQYWQNISASMSTIEERPNLELVTTKENITTSQPTRLQQPTSFQSDLGDGSNRAPDLGTSAHEQINNPEATEIGEQESNQTPRNNENHRDNPQF